MDDYDSADIDADDEGENSFLPFEFCASFSLGLSHNWRSLPMAQNDPIRLSDATVKIDQDSQALPGSVLPGAARGVPMPLSSYGAMPSRMPPLVTWTGLRSGAS
jgi:hypothetical protein